MLICVKEIQEDQVCTEASRKLAGCPMRDVCNKSRFEVQSTETHSQQRPTH